MLYRLDEQDVNSGGSGCGCSAAVVCSHIVDELRAGRLGRVLFVGTGALLSAVSPLQGETVPSIAHAVLLTNWKGIAMDTVQCISNSLKFLSFALTSMHRLDAVKKLVAAAAIAAAACSALSIIAVCRGKKWKKCSSQP
jgi:hypothetical protein